LDRDRQNLVYVPMRRPSARQNRPLNFHVSISSPDRQLLLKEYYQIDAEKPPAVASGFPLTVEQDRTGILPGGTRLQVLRPRLPQEGPDCGGYGPHQYHPQTPAFPGRCPPPFQKKVPRPLPSDLSQISGCPTQMLTRHPATAPERSAPPRLPRLAAPPRPHPHRLIGCVTAPARRP
jgi:hypothetical protein